MPKILDSILAHKYISSSIIFIFIAVVVFLIVYFSSSKKPEGKKYSYDKDAVDRALAGAGVNKRTEHFQDSVIVYDSYDKIKNNFETFMTTYFPILDVKIMNDMLKNDYGVDKNMQTILNEHTDANFTAYILGFTDMATRFLGLMLDDSTNIILCGLGVIILTNLLANTLPNSNTINTKNYYLEDYDEMNDFIIYTVPSSYDTSKITSTNPDIKYYDDIARNNITFSSLEQQIYKTSIKRNIKGIIIEIINNRTGKDRSEISDEEINKVTNIFKSNKNPLLKYIRLFIIGPFIKLNSGIDLTASSKIILDLVDLFTIEKHFNKDITPYLPTSENVSRTYYEFNTIFSDRSTYNHNSVATTQIIQQPTITANSTQTDIIKLYSDVNFAGSVKIYDVRDALDRSSLINTTIYDSSIDTLPKSLQIIQPPSSSNYSYIASLYYLTSDGIYIHIPTESEFTTIPVTQMLTMGDPSDPNSRQITGTLRYIFVYKNIAGGSLTYA